MHAIVGFFFFIFPIVLIVAFFTSREIFNILLPLWFVLALPSYTTFPFVEAFFAKKKWVKNEIARTIIAYFVSAFLLYLVVGLFVLFIYLSVET